MIRSRRERNLESAHPQIGDAKDSGLDEHWMSIENYPNYAISSYGRVLNLKYNNYLKPRPNSYGYLRVRLYNEEGVVDIFVHQLVAKHFMSGWKPRIHVRHADEDNSNNRADNLRFGTDRRHGFYKGRIDHVEGRRLRIRETGQTFRNVKECAKFIKGDSSSIYKVLKGYRETHRGYTFEFYKEE